jgi:hypothetical protein
MPTETIAVCGLRNEGRRAAGLFRCMVSNSNRQMQAISSKSMGMIEAVRILTTVKLSESSFIAEAADPTPYGRLGPFRRSPFHDAA